MARRALPLFGWLAGGAWLVLQACGAPDSASGRICRAAGAHIGGNHGHVLHVPLAALAPPEAGEERAHTMAGSAGHDHLVRFTPAQREALRHGHAVAVRSSIEFQHAHVLWVSCG